MQFYICYFFIYSFLGWVMEVLYALYDDKKLVNRGFLLGPYCPIYGFGSVFIIYILKDSLDDPVGLYLKAVVVAAILEYFTSFLMEKWFHARWWDYSDKKFNINGRICLEALALFGVLACFAIYIIQPFLNAKLVLIPMNYIHIILLILTVMLFLDCLWSFKLMLEMRSTIQKVTADNTIEIKKQLKLKFLNRKKNLADDFNRRVKIAFAKNSKLKNRILKAFPNVKFDFEEAKERFEKKKLAMQQKKKKQ